MADKLVVGLAGMAGSGKSIVVGTARENGYDIVVMGDEVREEARSRNVESNPDNLGKIMLELRHKEGEAAIAKRCIPKIERATKQRIIVDGIRSLAEVEQLRQRFPSFTFIAIHASPETRFKRLFKRKRSDDPENWEAFIERDYRELGVGLGNAIAMAEYLIVNEEDIDTAKVKTREVIRKIEEKWKR